MIDRFSFIMTSVLFITIVLQHTVGYRRGLTLNELYVLLLSFHFS